MTAASNALGVTPDIPAITAQVRAAGAWTIVDAVHAAPHTSSTIISKSVARGGGPGSGDLR